MRLHGIGTTVIRALAIGIACAMLPRVAAADGRPLVERGSLLGAPAPGRLAARRARAAGAREEADPFALELGVSTHFPLSLGVDAGVELPGRLLGQLHVGFLPHGYASAINGLATRAGWYDEKEATVVERVLERSVLLRPSIGVRPVPSLGLEFWLGYTRLRSGASVTGAELVEAGVVDRMPPGSQASAHAKLHGLTLALSYRFLPSDHVVVRASLAYTNVLRASIDIDSGHPAANREVSRRLEEIFESKVQTLELRIGLGLRPL